MNIKIPHADVGIIVGRFQVPYLHKAHLDLINLVAERHNKVIIFLGVSATKTTHNNPLDFEARKQMILDSFPDVNVLYIKDQYDDLKWSQLLDSQIRDLIGPTQTAVLYGGRDSFIPYYKGKFPVLELEPSTYFSGTELRKKAAQYAKNSADFRAGVIWAVENQFPVCYPTVDVAIVDFTKSSVLLGRKPGEEKFRFIGGFAAVQSESYEEDARREVLEETGLTLGKLYYTASFLLNDWRYKSEVNKPKTLFYIGEYVGGIPQADDDIAEVRWFNIDKLTSDDMMPVHKKLLAALKEDFYGK